MDKRDTQETMVQTSENVPRAMPDVKCQTLCLFAYDASNVASSRSPFALWGSQWVSFNPRGA